MKYFKMAKQFFLDNPKAAVGIFLVATVVLMCVFAPLLTDVLPGARVGRPHQAPNPDNILGTTRMGRDVWSQLLYGGRVSLMVGFVAGTFVIVMAMVIGIASGYFGGVIDNVLSFFTNLVMVIPSLPLMLVLAAFLDQVSPLVIAIIIGATSWPWGARVLRAQTLAIRNKDFVHAAEVMGETKPRMLFAEIMPNMMSILASSFIGTVIYAIMTQATLEFIGLGDPLAVTWGGMLYNADQTSAIRIGAWWEIMAPSVALASVAIGLALINFSIDEISNPKLKAQRIMARYRREEKKAAKQAAKQQRLEMESANG
ncbi:MULTISPECIES: ABC transporter permease [Vibrio]|uniref:ABC transporter permease n=1 Tax=Vibrio mediterranei TaxID=689 RepID=A0A241TCE2_9VIBR|nr:MULTISPECIES: ABC transporter permease [Vibrio]ASI92832.1 peptide ABC transporter permease [Vibrio mediterranei]AYV23133.1 ABC transporter permease [Vibrio mediterranei]MCF4174150.1 ABC transporter permease [Vibrio sp. McD22-P3]MCG9659080.1 ABC transporter permease [Vibrio mediterranei]MCG9662879.1 ABC transporter permease [Vibrio mediterranei]